MIVPVNCGCGECPEWVMVELQGELALREADEMTQEGFDVGVMCMKDKAEINLTIGYHRLDGKVMPLKKPIVIMEKSGGGPSDEKQGAQFSVAGVIRSKILFKNRPKALISKPEAGKR
mmetsp:Transcript_39982/g.102270  ORF Transcript_39982/g.102270 Transcript_39982/m.102270 type:complete len:118 (+) Transcript_39982:338-691(+)|eukprot:jgi/Tetstr1/459867/TSEL_000452.t1